MERTSPTTYIRGHVDGFNDCRIISGWAVDVDNLDLPCKIDICDSRGAVLATGRAQHERPDLFGLGYKHTSFAFRVPVTLPVNADKLFVLANGIELPNSPLCVGSNIFDGSLRVHDGYAHGSVTERCIGGQPPTVIIRDHMNRIVAQANEFERRGLDDEPFIYSFTVPLQTGAFGFNELLLTAYANQFQFATTRARMEVQGYVDVLEPQRIAGWLNSQYAPDHIFELEVYAGDEKVGSGFCNLPRDDLKELFPRNWKAGFDIELTISNRVLDDIFYSIRLAGASTEVLGGSYVFRSASKAIAAAHRIGQNLRELGANVSQDVLDASILQRALGDFIASRRLGRVLI